ncbi:MAG: hypothetical protein QNJ33_12315 [Crocosphaera sp.]|nr:hypothetical protein [Crocosphaera sp.]
MLWPEHTERGVSGGQILALYIRRKFPPVVRWFFKTDGLTRHGNFHGSPHALTDRHPMGMIRKKGNARSRFCSNIGIIETIV